MRFGQPLCYGEVQRTNPAIVPTQTGKQQSSCHLQTLELFPRKQKTMIFLLFANPPDARMQQKNNDAPTTFFFFYVFTPNSLSTSGDPSSEGVPASPKGAAGRTGAQWRPKPDRGVNSYCGFKGQKGVKKRISETLLSNGKSKEAIKSSTKGVRAVQMPPW